MEQLDFNILSGRLLDYCRCLTGGLVPGVTTVDIYTIYLQLFRYLHSYLTIIYLVEVEQ